MHSASILKRISQTAVFIHQLTSCVILWSFCIRRLVIDTLKDVDASRKCFRLVGGVLVERTVKEVLPALESNKEQVRIMINMIGAVPMRTADSREAVLYKDKRLILLVMNNDMKT